MTAATHTGAAPARPWYGLDGVRYEAAEPPFQERSDHPWVAVLEDNWELIRDEITALLARRQDRLEPYFNRAMVFPPASWKTLGFFFWNWRIHKNCRACPRTVALLESIPNLTAASLSVLEPHANINPHQGDTNAIVRTHLGLDIPAPLPACGLQVGREVRGWENGKATLFIDAFTHSSWNQSDRRRLVLIVDVMRPEFARSTNAVCTHVLASTCLQMIYQRFTVLQRMPAGLQFVIHAVARVVVGVCLPFQRRFG